MELLRENGKTFLRGIITESNTKGGIAIFGRDYRNRNGRVYPNEILEPAFKKMLENLNEAGYILSYRNHPTHSNLIYEDSCAKLIEARWDSINMRGYGKFEILEDTKDGKQVLKDIDEGVLYGNSTRALGSLNEKKEVVKLDILTSDIIPIIERKDGKGYRSIQSCRSCTLSLTESLEESLNESNDTTFESYFDDGLIIENSDCDCYLDLSEIEQKVIQKNITNKLIDIINSF